MRITPLASILVFSLVACGGMDSAPNAKAFDDAPAAAAKGGGGGGGRFEIGANNLYFNPDPVQGEVSLSGFVVVTGGAADTVVTANGVALLRDPALNGEFYRVAAAGPQPQVAANGQLTLAASSASAGLSRTLILPCAGDETITANPPEGSSLAGVTSVTLSWNASLTSHLTTIPVPENASALLFGYDAASNTLGNAIPIAAIIGTTGTTLTVGPTASPGYAAVVTWPGQYRLDGQSGGQCGRVKRVVFAQ